MRVLHFEVPDFKQFVINNYQFKLLKSDMDIITRSTELQNKYAYFTDKEKFDKDDPKSIPLIRDAVLEIANYINETLETVAKVITNDNGDIIQVVKTYESGELTAINAIFGNVPIGMIDTISLLGFINTEVIKEYNASTVKKYGEQEENVDLIETDSDEEYVQ
ncbi:MAG: hypothetical protein FWC41_01550 [Firmicutes bacterium]|nr:hypothetical protein [Bacillota bacterium]